MIIKFTKSTYWLPTKEVPKGYTVVTELLTKLLFYAGIEYKSVGAVKLQSKRSK
jgi:hypothetical protein